MRRKRAISLLLTFACLSACGAVAMDVPLFYSAKEIRARIVDEQSGQPIEGAVVVAQWILVGLHGHFPTSFHIAEAVTDKQGEFYIPAWGPKSRSPLTQLVHYSPRLRIFKHGYVPLQLHNESLKEVVKAFPDYKTMSTKELEGRTSWYKGAPNQSVQESMWNSLSIQIEKFTGTADRWLELLGSVLPLEREEDKQVPRLFQAMAAERNYFKANPVSPSQQVGIYSLNNRIDQALK